MCIPAVSGKLHKQHRKYILSNRTVLFTRTLQTLLALDNLNDQTIRVTLRFTLKLAVICESSCLYRYWYTFPVNLRWYFISIAVTSSMSNTFYDVLEVINLKRNYISQQYLSDNIIRNWKAKLFRVTKLKKLKFNQLSFIILL